MDAVVALRSFVDASDEENLTSNPVLANLAIVLELIFGLMSEVCAS